MDVYGASLFRHAFRRAGQPRSGHRRPASVRRPATATSSLSGGGALPVGGLVSADIARHLSRSSSKPSIGDRDGDGYRDDTDGARAGRDFDNFADANGCGSRDNDRDGILVSSTTRTGSSPGSRRRRRRGQPAQGATRAIATATGSSTSTTAAQTIRRTRRLQDGTAARTDNDRQDPRRGRSLPERRPRTPGTASGTRTAARIGQRRRSHPRPTTTVEDGRELPGRRTDSCRITASSFVGTGRASRSSTASLRRDSAEILPGSHIPRAIAATLIAIAARSRRGMSPRRRSRQRHAGTAAKLTRDRAAAVSGRPGRARRTGRADAEHGATAERCPVQPGTSTPARDANRRVRSSSCATRARPPACAHPTRRVSLFASTDSPGLEASSDRASSSLRRRNSAPSSTMRRAGGASASSAGSPCSGDPRC